MILPTEPTPNKPIARGVTALIISINVSMSYNFSLLKK
jgi:hypothetical protein